MARFVTYEALELNRLDLIDFWFLVIFNAMAFFMYILLTCIKDNILVKSHIYLIPQGKSSVRKPFEYCEFDRKHYNSTL